MNFKTSSITRTGALINSTAFHSVQFSGVMANSVYKSEDRSNFSTRRNRQKTHREERHIKNHKCSAILNVIAPTRYMFFHKGNLSRLSFSEREFMALNISTVTRMERDIVVARWDISFVNMLHPMWENWEAHSWKCVCSQ
jgi:hypothetical protein